MIQSSVACALSAANSAAGLMPFAGVRAHDVGHGIP
jgi:hypothetical protein